MEDPELVYLGRSISLVDTTDKDVPNRQPSRAATKDNTYQKAIEKQKSTEELTEEKRKKDVEDVKQQLVAIDVQISEYLNQIERLQGLKKDLGSMEGIISVKDMMKGMGVKNEQAGQPPPQAFRAREGSLRIYDLIQAFNDLNSSIGDFGYEVLLSIDASAEERILKPEHYSNVYKVLEDPSTQPFFESISKLNLTAIDIIDPIVEYILCTQLMHTIFRSFAPGLDMELSQSLQKMHDRMRRVESSKESSQWGTLTYIHAATLRDDHFLQNAVDECARKISKVIAALTEDEEMELAADYTLAALRIFEMSYRLQEKVKTEYRDTIFDVDLVSCGRSYDGATMEISQAAGNSAETVWLSVGFGLSEARTTMKSDQSVVLESVVHVKAKVLCDNFVDRWTCPRLEGVQIGKLMYAGPYAIIHLGRWDNKEVCQSMFIHILWLTRT